MFGTMGPPMTEVFISYSHEEQEIADRISHDLTDSGYRIIRNDEVMPGDAMESHTVRVIRQAKFGLILISPSYVRSPWSRMELQKLSIAESEGGPRIIPLLVKNATFPMFLRTREFADFRQDYESAIERVKKALASIPEQSELIRARRRVIQSGIVSVIGGMLVSLLSGIVIQLIVRPTSDVVATFGDKKGAILIVLGLVIGLTGLVALSIALYVGFRHRSATQEALVRSLEHSYLASLDDSSLNPTSSGE